LLRTLVMAERTAETMTTSLSFFAKIAAFPDAAHWVLCITILVLVECRTGVGRKRLAFSS
jgi:hypothetical protein